MPLYPAHTAFSIEVIWVAPPPSLVPALTLRLTPTFAASALASFSMDTKKGLVKVLRIRATPTFCCVPPVEDEPPQAVTATIATRPSATLSPRRPAQRRVKVLNLIGLTSKSLARRQQAVRPP